MDGESVVDPRQQVIAYLDRRKCGNCRLPLASVGVGDLVPYHGVVFRCFPPAPTCWEFHCSGCGERLVICVRKGKAWPLDGVVTRRSPLPRRTGGPI
jgi:hypothetical protein